MFSRETIIESRGATSADWLAAAIEAEQTAKECGPVDPAFVYFCETASRYMRLALAAESEGR